MSCVPAAVLCPCCPQRPGAVVVVVVVMMLVVVMMVVVTVVLAVSVEVVGVGALWSAVVRMLMVASPGSYLLWRGLPAVRGLPTGHFQFEYVHLHEF